jgi:hypothetical protein
MSSLFRKAFIMFSSPSRQQYAIQFESNRQRLYNFLTAIMLSDFLLSFGTNRDVLQIRICRTQCSCCCHGLHIIGMNALCLHLLVKAMLQHRCFEVLLMSANLIAETISVFALNNLEFLRRCILTVFVFFV